MTDLNLLFLFADEHRWDTLGCYSPTYAHVMPNLNRLAESACIFDNAYCVDPVCTPSRGTLMTGLYPHHHGAALNNVPLHATSRCLPELLPPDVRARYRAEYHGKWHLGDEIFAQHGFERFVSIEDDYHIHYSPRRDQSARSTYHHFLHDAGFRPGFGTTFSRPFSCQLPERYSKPAFLADEATRFMQTHADQPWLLVVNTLEPHSPFYSCRDGQYDPDEVTLFPEHDHLPDDQAPSVIRKRNGKFLNDGMRDEAYDMVPLAEESQLRDVTARYLGLCSLADTHFGRILATLEESGQADRTIIVYTADHGEMMGSHHLMMKDCLYQASAQIPLIIKLPGQTRPLRLTGPVSHIDLAPTCLDLMGQPVPDGLPGRSLAPQIRQALAEGRDELDTRGHASDCVIMQNHQRTRTVVFPDGWRYTQYTRTGEHELYDLTADPGEHRNLAAEHPERVRQGIRQLRDWQHRQSDPLQLVEPEV